MAAPDEELVVHATPGVIAVVVVTAAFFSLLFIGGGLALVIPRGGNDGLVWGGALAGWLLGSATALRLRARFTAVGIDVRNAFRSYSARWDEVKAVRVIPAVWYASDASWAANMLQVETSDGRRFPIRCCTHLSQAQVGRLTVCLQNSADEYGFDLPPSLLPLWRTNATIR